MATKSKNDALKVCTNIKMIEQHYGHLQPAQKADVIAGRRMSNNRAPVVKKSATEEAKKVAVKLKIVK